MTKLTVKELLDLKGVRQIASAEENQQTHPQAPEFTHSEAANWINSEPLKMSDLKGKVVLLDIWTFGCWNCYRSFPWMNDLEKRLSNKGFQVVGVHTPEFDHEHDRNKVVAKAKEFNLQHPRGDVCP